MSGLSLENLELVAIGAAFGAILLMALTLALVPLLHRWERRKARQGGPAAGPPPVPVLRPVPRLEQYAPYRPEVHGACLVCDGLAARRRMGGPP